MDEKAHKTKNDYEKALAAYSAAMKVFHKGEYEKALEMLKTFLEKHTTEAELVDRAKIYIDICDNRTKKEKFTLTTFEDFYQYGVYELNRKNFKEALELLEKASKKNPKDGKIYYLIASAQCLLEETDSCLENLKKAIQLDKYFKILAQNEKDFEKMREDKRFKLLTKLA